MILVAVTNPRYKLLLVLVAAIVVMLAIWALDWRQESNSMDNTPVIEPIQVSPQIETGVDLSASNEQGLVNKLKRYYKGQ